MPDDNDDDDGNSFSFPSSFHLIIQRGFWIYWTSWVSSLPPLHPQVILISEVSVSFFLPMYVPVTRGNHGEGGGVLDLTGSPEQIKRQKASSLKMFK